MGNLLLRVNFDKHFEKNLGTGSTMDISLPTRKDNYLVGDIMTINWTFPPADTGHTIRIRLLGIDVGETTTGYHDIATGILIDDETFSFVIPAIGDSGRSLDGGQFSIQLRDLDLLINTVTEFFSIGDYNKYYSLGSASVDGYQWINNILNEPMSNENVGEDKVYTASNSTIELSDKDNELKDLMKLGPYKFLYGCEAELYDEDGNTVRLFTITDWNFSLKKITLTLADKFGSFLDTPVWNEYITLEEFPNAVTGSLGQLIPFSVGLFHTVDTDGFGSIKSWYVNKSANEKYIVGKRGLIPTISKVYDPSEVDITASCTLVLGTDGYYYINYATVVDFIYVYASSSDGGSPYKSTEYLGSILDLFKNDYLVSHLDPYFANNNIDNDQLSGIWFYAVTAATSGKQILKDLCEGLGLDYYIDNNNVIVFDFIDYSDFTPDKVLQNGEVLSFFERSVDTTKMKNSIVFSDGYDPKSGSFSETKNRKNREAIRDWKTEHAISEGYKVYGSSSSYLLRGEQIAKISLLRQNHPLKYVDISTSVLSSNDIDLLSLIEFIYPSSETPETARLYQVKGKMVDLPNNRITLTLWDIEHFKKIDWSQKTLINANSPVGSEIVYDDGVDGFFTIWFNSLYAVSYSTSIKNFGESSIYFNGSASLQVCTLQDKWRLDFLDTSITTEGNIEGWFYFAGLGSNEYLYMQYEDANNFIEIKKRSTNDIAFNVNVGGSLVVSLISTTILSVTTWHHVNVCRDSSGNIGLYINGILEAHVLYASSVNINSFGILGENALLTNWFTGYMDGFQINHNNKYKLLPDAGLTNYFILPTEQQGFNKIVQSYEITEPKGKIALGIGKTYNINFIANMVQDDSKIILYQNDVVDYIIINPLDTKLGTYAWTVNPVGGIGSNYSLRINDRGASLAISDDSEKFIIGESDTQLLLHSNFDDGFGFFFDSSLQPNTHELIKNGSTMLHSTEEKKFNKSSMKFVSANTDYLSISGLFPPTFSNQNNVVLDLWFNPSDVGATDKWIFENQSDINERFYIKLNSSGKIQVILRSSGSDVFSSTGTTTLVVGTWYHVIIAQTHYSSFGIYINGVQEAFGDPPISFSLNGTCFIGSDRTQTNTANCYIDELRLAYSNPFGCAPNPSFTDVVTIPVKPYDGLNPRGYDGDTETKFLLHSNQPDGASSFGDSSLQDQVLVSGTFGQFHSTDQSVFGGSSVEFIRASGQYLSIYNLVGALDIGNQSTFTVDCWVRLNALGTLEVIYVYYEDASNNISIQKQADDTIWFKQYISAVDKISLVSATSLSANTWHHIAVIRDGSGNVGMYIDGVQDAYQSYSTLHSIHSGFTKAYIGAWGHTDTLHLDGFIDEFRISHGNPFNVVPNVGLTSSFTPPITAYTGLNPDGS